MLRKLITLAITTGLAKKAWDAYQQKAATRPVADAGEPKRKAPARRRKVGEKEKG